MKIRLPCVWGVILIRTLLKWYTNILCFRLPILIRNRKFRIFMTVWRNLWMKSLKFAVRWNMTELPFPLLMRMGNWVVPLLAVTVCKETMWRIMWKPSVVFRLFCMVKVIRPNLKFVEKFWCLGKCLKNWIVSAKLARNRFLPIRAMLLRERWNCRTLLSWLLASWMLTYIIY